MLCLNTMLYNTYHTTSYTICIVLVCLYYHCYTPSLLQPPFVNFRLPQGSDGSLLLPARLRKIQDHTRYTISSMLVIL